MNMARQALVHAQLTPMNENIIIKASLALFDKNDDNVQLDNVTNYVYAAWLGFLITFLNLLPAWQLDGGHMSRVILEKVAQDCHVCKHGCSGFVELLDDGNIHFNS